MDAEISVYVAWCEDHDWMGVEYEVTEDNKEVIEEFLGYEYCWKTDFNSTDTLEVVEKIYCPLCDETASLIGSVCLDDINKWDLFEIDRERN